MPAIPPVIIEDDGSVVGRLDVYRAAKRLGLKTVPAIYTRQLTSQEKYRFEAELAGEPIALFRC